MGWYSNQKARHEAAKRGDERPRTGGLGDKLADAVDRKVEQSKEREAALAEEKRQRKAERR
jgi:hypothetical protein